MARAISGTSTTVKQMQRSVRATHAQNSVETEAIAALPTMDAELIEMKKKALQALGTQEALAKSGAESARNALRNDYNTWV